MRRRKKIALNGMKLTKGEKKVFGVSTTKKLNSLHDEKTREIEIDVVANAKR